MAYKGLYTGRWVENASFRMRHGNWAARRGKSETARAALTLVARGNDWGIRIQDLLNLVSVNIARFHSRSQCWRRRFVADECRCSECRALRENECAQAASRR